jgi:hypothetical protein
LLTFREMIQAEETSRLLCIFSVHNGRTALDPSGIVLETDGKSVAADIPLLDVLQQFVAFPKILPGLFLLRQELETESGETFPSVEGGVSLLFKRCASPPGSDRVSHS